MMLPAPRGADHDPQDMIDGDGGRRRDHDPAQIVGQALGHHVLRDGSAVAYARIGSGFDDIQKVVRHPDVDLDHRVALVEERHHGGEEQRARMFENVEADPPGHRRGLSVLVEPVERGADRREWGLQRSEQIVPRRGQRHAAAGAIDEAYAEAQRRGYEIVHPLTDEPWGIRRFFVRAPDGTVINVAGHRDA